jgi:hypothetical protein
VSFGKSRSCAYFPWSPAAKGEAAKGEDGCIAEARLVIAQHVEVHARRPLRRSRQYWPVDSIATSVTLQLFSQAAAASDF